MDGREGKWWEGLGGLEGQVRQGQPQVARLEVETGDEKGLGDERLVEEVTSLKQEWKGVVLDDSRHW